MLQFVGGCRSRISFIQAFIDAVGENDLPHEPQSVTDTGSIDLGQKRSLTCCRYRPAACTPTARNGR
jgi:hypothetical protein